VSQTDGMIFGRDGNLYFGALGENAIYKWEAEKDRIEQGAATIGQTEMRTQTLLASDDAELIWPDTFAMAEG